MAKIASAMDMDGPFELGALVGAASAAITRVINIEAIATKVAPTISLTVALLLAGCAASPGGIAGRSADKPKEVIQLGVVESVTPIELDASSYAGANVGGVFGQVGGAGTGGGRGAVVGSVLGGVVGSTLGHQAGIATTPGLEIWVRLDETGKSTYVMQPGKPEEFKAGDRVRVIRKDGEARVEPVPATETPKETPKP